MTAKNAPTLTIPKPTLWQRLRHRWYYHTWTDAVPEVCIVCHIDQWGKQT
jgi:hypothetical protein